MNTVKVKLAADRQGLHVAAPDVIAGGVIDLMRFEVDLSDEWAEFESRFVMLRNGGEVRACEIVEGVAVADAEAVGCAGVLEVAIMAQDGGRRLTTERATIPLYDGGF